MMRTICWIRSSLLPTNSVLVKVEAARISETLATTYQTRRGHDTEDQNPNCQHHLQLIIQFEKNKTKKFEDNEPYTGCPRRNGQNFGRVFLMLNYTDITQNNYIQSSTVSEIMAIEKCGLLGCPRTVRRP